MAYFLYRISQLQAINIQYVMDEDFKTLIEIISTTETDNDLLKAVQQSANLMYASGYGKPLSLVSMTDKDDIIHCLTLQCTVVKHKAELDQILEGFDVLRMMPLLRKHRSLLQVLMTPANPLTIDSLMNLFLVDYAIEGSNIRYE